MGCVFWEHPNPDFLIQKEILRFLGENRKTDLEPIKSTLWADSSDKIEIGTFEIHHLIIFFGSGFEKSIFDKRFCE